MKWCCGCGQTKSFSEFYKNRTRKDGHQSECKTCAAAYRRRYEQSERGKATKHRYEQSERGKATSRNYAQSEKGRAMYREAARRHRLR